MARLTEWGAKARKRLRGKDCHDCLFEEKDLAEPGNRNSTLYRYIGQAVAVLYPSYNSGLEGTTKEHIYGMFYEPCSKMGHDNDGVEWADKAWDMIVRIWAIESTKVRTSEDQVTLQRRKVLRGYLEWNPGSEGATEEETLAHIHEHAIAAAPRGFYVLKENGYFDSVQVKKDQLIARIRELKMENIIPIIVPKADGSGFRKLRAQEVIDEHSTVIVDLQGVVSKNGGYIRNNVFHLPLYHRREDLEPKWSDSVDGWIQAICPNKESYEKLCNWIGNALAFEDGPICALSIVGDPGCGKKMLAVGMAECINTETMASGSDFGRFSAHLFKTPFVVINEGFPVLKDGMHPADTFRIFTAGDPITVERKYADPVDIRSPLRLMLLANNHSVVRAIAKRRDLSAQDREALAVRLFHMETPRNAAAHLRTHGGMNYTAKPGSRWIAADHGAQSDYIVARHFLWLYKNRKPVPKSNRLLVEGDPGSEIIRILSTQSGYAPEIMEVIVSMVQSSLPTRSGIVCTGKDVYVTTHGVVNHFRHNYHKSSGIKLTTNNVSSVLHGIAAADWDPSVPSMVPLEEGKKSHRAVWWKIRAETLYREAVENGYRCTKLEEMLGLEDIEVPDYA
jgi:hypothetical protein